MSSNGERVLIDLEERSYDIVVGAGLLNVVASFEGLPPANAALIVSNPTV
eukprot:gene56441-75367_t